MKAVILCGGTGSRLYPLTKCINKHLLPVGGKPMAQWAIESLVEAGITEILIVSGQEHCGSIISQFGDGSEYGCSLTYKVQAKAGGIAQALNLAKGFSNGDDICVILGDNIFDFSIRDACKSFTGGATIFLKKVEDPCRYGVAEVSDTDGNGIATVLNIVEKPKDPVSNLAVTGIYMYDRTVFDKISVLKPSGRGELEITDVNMGYLKEGTLTAVRLSDESFWSDAGTFPSYHFCNDYFNRKGTVK